ncbi:hypothetical protein ACQQ2Q_08210 [Agrobacterium sp. ES01]|uniref:hypothetical protein n=1 Tax=Agrobacterium sp. ES01 TaxID=3420714 RepID=UPI003D0E969D
MLRHLQYLNVKQTSRVAACASLLLLAGCMTGAKDQAALGLDIEDADLVASADVPRKTPGGYVDPMVANAADPVAQTAADGGGTTDTAQLQEAPEDLGAVVMQQTGVNAGRSSIFSAYQAVEDAAPVTASETPSSLIPAGMPQRGIHAASGSLFSAPAAAPATLPPSEDGALY